MSGPTRDVPILRRGLKPLSLFAVMFFIVCAGPFGIEEMVPLAGPGLAILALLVMAVLWGAPYALVTAELVAALPQEGGQYVWYRETLGRFWAFQLSWLDWLTWLFDSAIYPPLIAAYLVTLIFEEPAHWVTWIVCLVVIWSCTWLNIRGVKAVGRFSVALAVAVLAPLVALVFFGWSEVSFTPLQQWIPEGTEFSEALTYALIWGIWCYSGYEGLAYAAEEIEDTERSYPKILALLLPFSAMVYVLPLLVTLGANPSWAQWETAQFADAARIIGGPWLAFGMVVAAQIALIAIFNGELLVNSRLPFAMARDGFLPQALTQLHPRHATPHLLLVIQAVLLSVLCYFWGFVEILVFSTWLSMPTYVIGYALPFVLRWKQPQRRGAFRVPGGWTCLSLVCLFPVLIALYVLFNVPWEQVRLGVALIVVGPVLYFLAQRWNRRSKAGKAHPGETEAGRYNHP
ncbi:MAG: APC family permease [Acidobacteriota bacterium]